MLIRSLVVLGIEGGIKSNKFSAMVSSALSISSISPTESTSLKVEGCRYGMDRVLGDFLRPPDALLAAPVLASGLGEQVIAFSFTEKLEL